MDNLGDFYTGNIILNFLDHFGQMDLDLWNFIFDKGSKRIGIYCHYFFLFLPKKDMMKSSSKKEEFSPDYYGYSAPNSADIINYQTAQQKQQQQQHQFNQNYS